MLIEENPALAAVLSYLLVFAACAIVGFFAADGLFRLARLLRR